MHLWARVKIARDWTVDDLASMSDDDLMALAEEVGRAARADWELTARREQRPPRGWRLWLFLAGRGTGKTRSAAEEVLDQMRKRPGSKWAVIARRDIDLDRINFMGDSGVMTCAKPSDQASYNRTSGSRKVTLGNGSQLFGYSAEAPENIAGENLDGWWIDEFALMPPDRASLVVQHLLMATRRKGSKPKGIITTTPRPVEHLKSILRDAEKDQGIKVTRGKTSDNRDNLAEEFITEIYRKYDGTRTGRQELHGELLLDTPGSLWSHDHIAAARGRDVPASFDRIGVFVDPSGSATGDATGIAVVGVKAMPLDGYTTTEGVVIAPSVRLFCAVLADRTTNGTPEERYAAVVQACLDWDASVIGVEVAYAGDNTMAGIRSAWADAIRAGKTARTVPSYEPLKMAGDKVARAETASLYYQQGHVAHAVYASDHRDALDLLEAEQTSWVPPGTKTEDDMAPRTSRAQNSPNRMDAAVWGILHLTGQTSPAVLGRTMSVSLGRTGGAPRPQLPRRK